MEMSKQTVCAFSTSDDGYAVHSALSLLRLRAFHPDIDLFLIGRTYSEKTKRFLKKYRIEPIELDLNDKFYKAWDYPVECYYIFAGPEELKRHGFDYSIYVDGDVYCNNDPFNFNFSKVKDFAGAFTSSTIGAILGNDQEKAVELFKNREVLDEKRIQTGVVYFNNSSLTKRKFLDKISAVYKTAIDENIPRKGDDSLLALFRLAYPSWNYLNLGDAYNKISPGFRAVLHSEWATRDQEMITDGVFFHFTNHSKPWANTSRFPTYTHQYFYHAWRRHAIDTLSVDDLRALYPAINAVLTDEHLRFYWYPTDNVGDLITPYFLEKVCGIKNIEEYTISEEEINSIEKKYLLHLPQITFFLVRVQRKLLRIAGRSKETGEYIYVPQNKALYGVSTGSVIRLCKDYAMVFGSGIRSKDQLVHHSKVRSVRGPRTRQRFIDSGYYCPPIYGDPGLLLPKFYKPKRLKRKYKIGIIPHFTEYDDIVKQYRNRDDVIIINMGCGDLEKVIDQIAACEYTLSSSLHGLVLSHAYGVPTRQVEYSDRINGDGTKFHDYYEGIGLTQLDPIDAAGCAYLKPEDILKQEFEVLSAYNDRQLADAMFFNKDGFKPSAYYPYA